MADVLYARDIEVLDDHDCLERDDALVSQLGERIAAGDVFIVKDVIAEAVIDRIRAYLTAVARNSIPAYHPIEVGAPNHFRLNRSDPRSYVAGAFHQFSFFPWNQDVFNLFEIFRTCFRVKNRLGGIPADRFLKLEPEDGCTARVSVQHYPKGEGFLNPHSDPVDRHQLVVPSLTMSLKGRDFQEGGLYVETSEQNRIDVDALVTPGDVVYFNARLVHGVERIDPGSDADWLALDGRWMALLAVNRLASTTSIGNAMELG